MVSSSEKVVEIPENEGAIVPDINDHVAAGHDRKVYNGKVPETDDLDAQISFYEHDGTVSIGSIFRQLEIKDEFGLTS